MNEAMNTNEQSGSSGRASSPKRKTYPHCDDNPKRIKLADSEYESTKSVETYRKGGLVHSLHGNIYQLKLQMLFLKRALDEKYEFYLGTEVEDAEKFDDIVFRYKRKDESGRDEIRFVQAKHRQDESKKITYTDLLNVSDGDFSLKKYFISYRSIMKKSMFSKCKIKDFIIFINIDFGDLNKASIKTDCLIENDNILKVTLGKSTRRLKLVIPKDHEVYDLLRGTSDLNLLVDALKQCINNKKRKCKKLPIIKLYQNVLSQKIFDIMPNKTVKFRDEFLNGTNLSENVSNFRSVLQAALNLEDDEQFKNDLSQKELNLSLGYRQALEMQSNPIVTNAKSFARKFAELIFNAKEKNDDVVTINRTSGIIDSNINKLAYHILVQDTSQSTLTRIRSIFFDDIVNLQGNLEDFKVNLRTELNKCCIDFGALRDYKFKISNFQTCTESSEGELLYTKKELPNDKIEDTDINDFFDKLIFAVNQPNVDELGDIISDELGESSKFNLLNPDLVSDSFQRKMLDWFKEKRTEKGNEGVWLNAETGERFMTLIEQKVSGVIAVGIGIAYPEKLETYKIKFTTNSVLFENLKAFLSGDRSSTQICHVIARNETMLSAINVHSTLEVLKSQEQFAYLKKSDSYIFMRLRTLIGDTIKKYVLDAIEMERCYNLLILDCKSAISTRDKRRLCKKLSDILLNTSTKLIFIGTKNENLINEFEEHAYLKLIDDSRFCDLTEESKQILSERKIIFQGKTVPLNKMLHILDEKENCIIDDRTLVKLIKDENISVSKELKDLGEVDDYYIDRRFTPVMFEKKNIREYLEKSGVDSDLFVISGDANLGLQHSSVYVFDTAERAKLMFNKLRDQNSNKSIHWFNSDSIYLTWYYSYGSISNLVQYCERADIVRSYNKVNSLSFIEEINFIRENSHHKIVVISNTAGMGKSTVLTHLSLKLKQEYSDVWVVRINLNDHTDALDDRKLKLADKNMKSVLDFISDDLLEFEEPSELEKKLFRNRFYKHGKIILLLDGFDEISPNYKEVVIDLLQSVEKSKVDKIIVTTRPSLRNELESKLGVFSYMLDPLTKNEQILFLIKFWTKKLGLDSKNEIMKIRLTTYADALINKIYESINDKQHEFISVPLQTMMIAEIFQKNLEGIPSAWKSCKEFLESELNEPIFPNKIALIDLYKHFSERKFYEFYLVEKKDRKLKRSGEKKSADRDYKLFQEEHALLAIRTLFGEKELKKLLPQKKLHELNCLIQDIQSCEHNEGIIEHVINGKPRFIHRTFAEYFASFIIAEKILEAPVETLQCIDDMLFNASPIFISSITEQLDGKQKDVTTALGIPLLNYVVKNKCINFIKSLLESYCNDWPEKLDAFSKTPLHYAIEQGNIDFVEQLLELADDIHDKNILRHGSFIDPNYEFSNLVKFINKEDRDGKSALYYAIHNKYIDLAFELLLKGACLNSLDHEDINKLIHDMLHSKISYNIYASGILGVYADQENKYRPIQEKLFLKAPGIFNELCLKDQCRILSYFFVHGRVTIIDKLLGTIEDLQKRTNILNSDDNGYMPLDRVVNSNQLNDEDTLEITKYLIEHGSTLINMNRWGSFNYISQILFAAARRGNLKTFKHFIALEEPKNYNMVLFEACEYHQYAIVKYMIENYKNIVDKDGNGPLHTACCSSAPLELMKYLIEQCDVNATNNKGESALFMAIYFYDFRKKNRVKYLINNGADITWEDKKGNTPLSLALENNHIDLINYLVQKGVRCVSVRVPKLLHEKLILFLDPTQSNLDLVDATGCPRLHNAIKDKNIELIQFLLLLGADVNKKDAQGQTPLHTACKNNEDKIVEILLQYGAYFDQKDSNNKTPLDFLCGLKNNKIVWLLMTLYKLFNSENLMQALKEKLIEKLDGQRLKDWGPYGTGHPDAWDGDNPMLFILNVRNANGRGLFHVAAEKNDESAIYELLKLNLDYVKRKKEFSRPARYQDYQSTSINVKDNEKNTPMHLAAQNGHIEIVWSLLREGAIFNSKNIYQETANDIALKNVHSNIVQLLQKINNLFANTEQNNFTLLEAKNCIMEQKSFINARNESGKTLLHIAASLSNLVVVQLLLDHNADIRSIDLDSNTPLHVAAESDKINNIKLLLKYGAMYNAKNIHGQKPFDIAHGQSRNMLGCIDVLFEQIQSDNARINIHSLEVICKEYQIDISTIVNVRDNQCNTLLHYACVCVSWRINNVKLLLENGAMFDACNTWGESPKEFTYNQEIDILLKTLQDMFEDVDIYFSQKKVSLKMFTNVIDETGKGLLYYAVRERKWDKVQFLVENGAHVNLLHIFFNMFEELPCFVLDVNIMKYLIDNGVVNATNNKGETPLLLAVKLSSELDAKQCSTSRVKVVLRLQRILLDVIKYLVTKGSEVNCKDVFGNTPLAYAVERNVIKYLSEMSHNV